MELAVVQFWKIACRLPTRFNMLLLSYCVIQQLCIPAFFFYMNEVKTDAPQELACE